MTDKEVLNILAAKIHSKARQNLVDRDWRGITDDVENEVRVIIDDLLMGKPNEI